MLRLFIRLLSRALMLLLVLPLTNSARGLVAKWMGDDTADREGRITLNPLAHLDLLGSLAIMLCGFGWSKPMPISPTRMRNYKLGVIMISLTGPVTHFISAIICYAVCYSMICADNIANAWNEFSYYGIVSPVACLILLIQLLANINVCLGVINILPLPPMDGFNILHQFAGSKFNRWYYTNYRMINQVSLFILLGLFIIGDVTDGLIDPLGWLIGIVDSLLRLTVSWIPHVFG